MPPKNKGANNRFRKGRGHTQKSRKPQSNSFIEGSGTRSAIPSFSRMVEAAPPLFKRNFRTMLRYAGTGQLVSASGAVATIVYSGNGCFDPDITGGGTHQPKGFDSGMLTYVQYCVDRVDATVALQNTASGSFHAGVRMTGETTPLTSATSMLEEGSMINEVLEAKNTYGSCKTIKFSIPIAKFRGISRKALLIDPEMSGQINANPAEGPYIHVMAWDPNSLSGTVFFDIVLEYHVTFYEPREQPLSLTSALKRVILDHLEDQKSVKGKQPPHENEGTAVMSGDDDVVYLPSNRLSLPNISVGCGPSGRSNYCNQPECRFYGTNVPHERCATASNQAYHQARVSQTQSQCVI